MLGCPMHDVPCTCQTTQRPTDTMSPPRPHRIPVVTNGVNGVRPIRVIRAIRGKKIFAKIQETRHSSRGRRRGETMNKIAKFVLACLMSLALVAPALAHHSAAAYDTQQEV